MPAYEQATRYGSPVGHRQVSSPVTDDALPIESDTGPWAAVPAWVIDADISPRAFRLYAILSLYADGGVNGSGGTTRSRRALAARLGCSVDTLDRAVAELESIGGLGKIPNKDASGDRAPNRWIVYRVRPGSRGFAARGGRVDAAVKTPRPPEEPDPFGATHATEEVLPINDGSGSEQNGTKPKAARRKRVTSDFPESFVLTDAMRAWFATNHARLDIVHETRQFAAYHRANGSRKKDWEQAWRYWMGNAEKFARKPPPHPVAEKFVSLPESPNARMSDEEAERHLAAAEAKALGRA